TVAVLLLRALLDATRRAGVSPERLLSAIGVARSALDELDGWIPVEALTRAWMLAPALSQDPDFGLHASERAPTGVYGLLEYAAVSSPTLYEALERVARFYRMLGDMSEVGFVAEGSLVRVTLQPAVHLDANRLRHYTEHSLAVMVSRGRMLAERD